MRDVTQLVHRYRECVLGIWNRYLASPNPENCFDVHDRWADACVPLFRTLVLYPCGHDDPHIFPDYRGEQYPLPYIRIEPLANSEILINEAINSGIWNWNAPTHVGPDDTDLRFIAFFDWSVLDERSFEFVKVSIFDSNKYPEAKGREALIKTADVKFIFDEAEAERYSLEVDGFFQA
jgi:hypothetical protein